jgi:hypothetical protein
VSVVLARVVPVCVGTVCALTVCIGSVCVGSVRAVTVCIGSGGPVRRSIAIARRCVRDGSIDLGQFE